MTTTPFLRIDALQVRYGGIQAVKGISFEVHQGQTVGNDLAVVEHGDAVAEAHD